KSVFLGGFECSTHRRADGRRLDLLVATKHDVNVLADYRVLQSQGIHSVRDGVRWHLIETTPGRYDWSSFLPMLPAARQTGPQGFWDLCNYGYPDDLAIWSPAFVERFAKFCPAFATIVREETPEPQFYCPVNEISFWAWAGAQVAEFNPMCTG